MHAPGDVAHLLEAMAETQKAAFAVHQVEVKVAAQAVPQLQRELVQVSGLIPEVVGADDLRVSARVSTAHVALLQDGHVGDAVLFGQVVGGCETVSARADDNHFVLASGLRVAPGPRPVFVVAQSVTNQAEQRVLHVASRDAGSAVGAIS